MPESFDDQAKIVAESPILREHILSYNGHKCVIIDILLYSEINDGCILYIAQKRRPILQVKNKQQQLARVIYRHLFGKISNWVLHTCDVAKCWKPEHLYDGTREDNIKDMIRNGRTNRKYRDAEMHQMKRLYRQGVKMKDIADIYDTNRVAIAKYISGPRSGMLKQ